MTLILHNMQLMRTCQLALHFQCKMEGLHAVVEQRGNGDAL